MHIFCIKLLKAELETRNKRYKDITKSSLSVALTIISQIVNFILRKYVLTLLHWQWLFVLFVSLFYKEITELGNIISSCTSICANLSFIHRDCLIFACTNTGTSFLSGFIIFTILGHMAFLQGTTIDKVAESG